MNCIGIITAMNSEFSTANKAIAGIPAFNLRKQFSRKGYRLALWSHDEINIIIIRTGVGYGNARSATDFLLQNYPVDVIINPGIAGAINLSYSIGDLFVCNAVIYDKNPGEIIKIDNEFHPDIQNICDKTGINFFEGKVMTVSKPLFDSSKRDYIRETFNIDAVDMEMAAIAAETNKYQVPLLSFKIISDMADDSLKIFNVIFSKDGRLKISLLFMMLFKNPPALVKLITKTYGNIKKALITLEFFLIQFLGTAIKNR